MKTFSSLCFFLFLIFNINAQESVLEQAYKKKSLDQLNIFFLNWQEDIPPISDKEWNVLSDTIKDAYEVFSTFYKPYNLKELGKSEWGDTIYQNVDYYIVQNYLRISFKDKIYYSEEELDKIILNYIDTVPISKGSLDKYIGENLNEKVIDTSLIYQAQQEYRKDYLIRYNSDKKRFISDWELMGRFEHIQKDSIIEYTVISNFRPNIKYKKSIYLAPQYKLAISNFLGNSVLKIKERYITSPQRSKKESKRRLDFLENSINIWQGHWGGYWQLITYPEATNLVFDKDMKYAKIYFRLVYQGGETLLKKENDKWIIMSSKLTWIE